MRNAATLSLTRLSALCQLSQRESRHKKCHRWAVALPIHMILLATTTSRPLPILRSQVDKVISLSPYSGVIPVS